MAARERRLTRAERQIRRDIESLAEELRNARFRAGLTMRQVGKAAGVSPSTILRSESGRQPGPGLMLLARHAAAVGLRARIRVYPGDDPIRDSGQVALIRRFRHRLNGVGRWEFEVPIPHPFDQRALDAVLTLPDGRVGLEFYTRLVDVQAQLRAANAKKRDAGLDRLVIVVRGTHANRRALREIGPALTELFPGSSRGLLRSLAASKVPNCDGIVVI